jgi:hypothetical protein
MQELVLSEEATVAELKAKVIPSILKKFLVKENTPSVKSILAWRNPVTMTVFSPDVQIKLNNSSDNKWRDIS